MKKQVTSTIVLRLSIIALLLAGALIIYQSATQNTDPSGNATSNNGNATSDNGDSTSDATGEFVDFTVYNLQGEEVSLSDFVGKPMVVNFWASWCPPCKGELPDFEALSKQYEGEVQFLMINMTDGSRETLESASTFIEEEGYTFPVYYDTEGSAMNAYYTYSLPTTIFFDAEGNQVARYTGMMSADLLESYISKIH